MLGVIIGISVPAAIAVLKVVDYFRDRLWNY